jgi:hypothetical protein
MRDGRVGIRICEVLVSSLEIIFMSQGGYGNQGKITLLELQILCTRLINGQIKCKITFAIPAKMLRYEVNSNAGITLSLLRPISATIVKACHIMKYEPTWS